MIGGVNLYSGFSNIKPNTDENSLNWSSQKLVQNANQSSDQIKFNKDDEPLKFAKDYSLTGMAANGLGQAYGIRQANQPRRDKRA